MTNLLSDMTRQFKIDLLFSCMVAAVLGSALFMMPRGPGASPDYGDVRRLSDTSSDTGLASEIDDWNEDGSPTYRHLTAEGQAWAFDADVRVQTQFHYTP